MSAADHVVVIERTSLRAKADHTPPSKRVVVTSAADVRRLRDAINNVQTKPDGVVWGCPVLTGAEPEYVLAYQRTRTSAPDLVATTHEFCVASTGVSVHGHSRPLLEAGDLPTLAADLFERGAVSRH